MKTPVEPGKYYEIEHKQKRIDIRVVRLCSGLPKLWLCTDAKTGKDLVVGETAFCSALEPQPRRDSMAE
jgi:hypothetical protein